MNKSNSLKIGLVVGKFAQLHNGHLDLLRFALRIVNKLFVIVYHCPNKTSIPLQERAGWIRSFFPNENVVVIEGLNAPVHHKNVLNICQMQEKYLGNIMAGINLTHIISSEDYGKHLSDYFGIKNVIYDKKRVKRPISSTLIRKNFDRYNNEVPEKIKKRVKQDLNVNIGLRN